MRSPSRGILSVISLLLIISASNAQSPQERQQRIRAAVESGDWKSAKAELNALHTADAKLFRMNDYDYLLGRVSEKTGEVAAASANYQSVISGTSLLSDYALWRLARIARSMGDLVLERERLRQLLAASSADVLHEAAELRLVESFYESGDYSASAGSARHLSLSKNASLARQAATLLGQSYLHAGNTAEARDVFTRLLMQMPDASRPDDFALAAVRALDVPQQSDNSSLQLSEADHLLRASVYQFNRDFAGARLHYLAIVNRNPQSSTLPNILYQLGRGFYLEGNYEEARNYFQKTFDQFPESTSARDALSYLAASYSRLKRVDDAILSYKLVIDRFPAAPNPERPYLNIIDALHEAGRYPEALNWVEQTRARLKGNIGSTLALFAQLRIHLAQNLWKESVADADELLKLSDLGGTGVPGGTTQGEVAFLRGYALEQIGRIDEAIAGYLSIPDGRNEYYGMRATDRLRSLGKNEKTRTTIRSRLTSLLGDAKAAGANGPTDQERIYAQRALRLADDPSSRAEVVQILQATYDTLLAYKLRSFNLVQLGKQDPLSGDAPTVRRSYSHQAIADDLLFLDLYDEAMPELFAARAAPNAEPQTGNSNDTAKSQVSNFGSLDNAYTVATYSLLGGLPYRAVRFGEQFWKSVPPDYVLELAPRGLVELLYPIPYTESLLKHAPASNVDPRFVLAIARQESRYRADAKSVAAARGMMQFISSTASEIATVLKPGTFNQDDLYDPDTAIRFGSLYLANLFRQFPNQPEAVAAAYNGGADNVARWVARSRAADPERYVPEIGFSQTKDYVFRVMSNFWNYERLYDARLKPQPTATK